MDLPNQAFGVGAAEILSQDPSALSVRAPGAEPLGCGNHNPALTHH
jgi:hypothetical protein